MTPITLYNWYIRAHPGYPENLAPTVVIGTNTETEEEISFFEEDIKEASGKSLLVKFEGEIEPTRVSLQRPSKEFANWVKKTWEPTTGEEWDAFNPVKLKGEN